MFHNKVISAISITNKNFIHWLLKEFGSVIDLKMIRTASFQFHYQEYLACLEFQICAMIFVVVRMSDSIGLTSFLSGNWSRLNSGFNLPTHFGDHDADNYHFSPSYIYLY